MEFLIKKCKFTYKEITQVILNEQTWQFSLNSFINDNITPKYTKNISKSIEKVIICKEDKESITKSRIVLITQLFSYLYALDDKSLQSQAMIF
jgi:hypothetical protein